MSRLDLQAFSSDFAALAECHPEGLTLSDRMGDPVISIEKDPQAYRAKLLGRRKVKGEFQYGSAPSRNHNWYIDGSVIRPLPNDVGEILKAVFCEFDLDQLSFADVLALRRLDQNIVVVELAENVLTPARVQAAAQPKGQAIPGLNATLLGYQATGVSWMHDTLSHTGGLILADEMGLGKTIQIISLLLLDPPTETAPALIVCPTSLISNWQREIFNFAPKLSVLVHRGPHRAGIFRGLQVAQVVIVTYDTVVNDISIFSAFEWGWMICDEAQAIKNPNSSRRIELATISRKRCIPMTGTPVENTLLDLWSLVDFAIPGLLGSQAIFEMEFPDDGLSAGKLKEITEPIVLRRMVKDVAGDLPDRIDIDLPISLGQDLALDYERVRAETMEEYPVAGALVASGQLQIFCAHPWLQAIPSDNPYWEENAQILFGDNDALVTPKLERTVSLIREALLNNRKVLVFSAFNKCGDLIYKALNPTSEVFWGAINGSTPQEERQSLVDAYSDFAGPACMVLNPKAAGAGLNITAATVVIHYTQVWNPALEAQASARAHRRGQTEPVTVYRLYYEDTVEEVMIERSKWKRELGNEATPITTRNASDLKRALAITPRREHE
ncbi:DEAD/DEAH box helicase [Tateyamaria sp.]|uniref:DEAD/DEAH box helicase n=1 Tax=Tateyamaria sp. TaxID=1929288 RepID=UPI00329B9EF4